MAVLVKKNYLPWEKQPSADADGNKTQDDNGKESESNNDDTNGDSDKKRKRNDRQDGRAKRPRYQGYKEDPFVYFDKTEEDPLFTEIKEYFQLKVN